MIVYSMGEHYLWKDLYERIGNAVPKTGGEITGTLVLSKGNDAVPTSYNSPALIVGGKPTGKHIEIDGNEILAKSNETTPTQLSLSTPGGGVYLAGGIQVRDGANITGGLVVDGVNIGTGLSNATSTANTANSTANTAKSTANTANSTANTAKSTANTANSTANTAKSLASAAMPKSGGTFTGNIAAFNTNHYGWQVFNSYVQNSSGGSVATAGLLFRRK